MFCANATDFVFDVCAVGARNVNPVRNIRLRIESNATQRNATQRNATQRNATQRNGWVVFCNLIHHTIIIRRLQYITK